MLIIIRYNKHLLHLKIWYIKKIIKDLKYLLTILPFVLIIWINASFSQTISDFLKHIYLFFKSNINLLLKDVKFFYDRFLHSLEII